MSKIRGVLPLFLATAFGIANGVWVFGPALKEQNNQELNKTQLAIPKDVDGAKVEQLRSVEAAASREASTESALKPVEAKSSQWWTSIWNKGPSDANVHQVSRPVKEPIEPTAKVKTAGVERGP